MDERHDLRAGDAADRGPAVTTGWSRRDDGETNDRDRSLHDLADATRRLIHHLHVTEAPLEVLDGIGAAVAGMARLLEAHPQGRVYEGFAEAVTADAPSAFFEFSPVIGRSNPLAPPAVLWVEHGVVHGRALFAEAYEGPPGCVHGGFIAATFDEVLGMTQNSTGRPGMTGTLTVRYRAPTPLHTELRLIGEVDRVEGRKLFSSGRMYAGDRLTAEADGVFVAVDPSQLASLADRRASSRRPAPRSQRWASDGRPAPQAERWASDGRPTPQAER